MSGILSGLLIAVPVVGIPESLREAELFLIAPLFMSVLFLVLHSVFGRIHSMLRIYENKVKYDTYLNRHQWKMEDLSGYAVQSIDLGADQARVLVLSTKKGIVHAFEIADQISSEDIESAFAGKLIQIQPDERSGPDASSASAV